MKYSMKDIVSLIVESEVNNPHLTTTNSDLDVLNDLKCGIERKLSSVYKNVTGNELNLPKIKIEVDDSIKKGKIAGYNHPQNGKPGVMGIKSKALDDMEYLKWVIVHELIHASVGEDLPSHEEHSGLFKKLADAMGLPKKYQD